MPKQSSVGMRGSVIMICALGRPNLRLRLVQGRATQRTTRDRKPDRGISHTTWAHFVGHFKFSTSRPTTHFVGALQIRNTKKNVRAFAAANTHATEAVSADQFIDAHASLPKFKSYFPNTSDITNDVRIAMERACRLFSRRCLGFK